MCKLYEVQKIISNNITMTKMEIIESIYVNKLLNDAINNIVDHKYIDDFKSHFIMQIANTNEEKLIELHRRMEIDWFCLRIMTNQWKSKNSSFWKIYRNNGFSGENIVGYTDNLQDEEINEEETPLTSLDLQELELEVKLLLVEQYDDFLVNNYHKKLFEMYYFNKLNLMEISKLTDINKDAISRSLRKTRKFLKNKLVK